MTPQILFGKVMHKRLFPKINAFNYGIYYLALPLSQLNETIENKYLKFNRWGLLSIYSKDHGAKDGASLIKWAHKILSQNDINNCDGEIILVTMPRLFGYVFNPVSFWYCFDNVNKLRAVICEVNNTFGETHSYLCAYKDNRIITKDDVMIGDKGFHVSPFLKRAGHYEFRFDMNDAKMKAHIDYFDENNQKQLITVLEGKFDDLNQKTIARAFWKYPLVTFKAIILIHWQAIRLVIKKIRYISKPTQNSETVTTAMKDNNKNV